MGINILGWKLYGQIQINKEFSKLILKKEKIPKKKKNSEGIKFPMLTYMGHDSIKISLNNESGHAMLKS